MHSLSHETSGPLTSGQQGTFLKIQPHTCIASLKSNASLHDNSSKVSLFDDSPFMTILSLQTHICASVSSSAETSTQTTSSLQVATAPQDGVCVVRLSVINEPPTFDIPLLLGPMLRVSCSAAAVSHTSGRNYLVTTASSVAYSTKVCHRHCR